MLKSSARKLFEKGVELEGLGENRDLGAALVSYRRAAILGDSKAQVFLALYYAAGQNHRKNHRLALAWFKRAAFAGEELCEMAVHRGENSIERQINSFRALLKAL